MKSTTNKSRLPQSPARKAWGEAREVMLAQAQPFRLCVLTVVALVFGVSIWLNGVGPDGSHANVKVAWCLVFIFLPFGIIFAKKNDEGGDWDFDPIGEAIDVLLCLLQFICSLWRPFKCFVPADSYVSLITTPPAPPPRARLAV